MSKYSRQARNEQIWAKRFEAFLSDEYERAAANYPEDYESDTERLSNMMYTLHSRIIIHEAEDTYVRDIMPHEPETDRRKDILDLLAGAFRGAGLINFWRDLIGNYLQARIANKIRSITNTTRLRIMAIIQQGLEDGDDPERIARHLRAQSRTSMNVHRSRAIARTETMSAMNQGALLAARTSNLQMEKRWDATLDQRTRLTHREADVRGEWIDIDGLFWIANRNGELESADGPGDAQLSPENSVNCRCGLDIRVKRDQNGNVIRK